MTERRHACAIRALTPADLPVFRDLRLRALREEPESFGASHEDEAKLPPEGFARWISPAPGCTMAAFDGPALVGMVGLMVPTGAKARHKGGIKGVYVLPSHRGRGLSADLLDAAIAHAREAGLLLLQLTVVVGNGGARRVYEAAGFRTYGIERRALLVDGRFLDEEAMELALDDLPSGVPSP